MLRGLFSLYCVDVRENRLVERGPHLANGLPLGVLSHLWEKVGATKLDPLTSMCGDVNLIALFF
jgi:hypothetical protein